MEHSVIQKFFKHAQSIFVINIVGKDCQTGKNDADLVTFHTVQAILSYFQNFEHCLISRLNLAHYPKVLGKFDQFLTLCCIDQTHCNLLFIQDAVSGVLVQIDFDEIFEVFLNLRVIEVKDVNEFAVILFNSFQLGQVVAVGIDAHIV